MLAIVLGPWARTYPGGISLRVLGRPLSRPLGWPYSIAPIPDKEKLRFAEGNSSCFCPLL